MRELSIDEMKAIKPGEAATIATVMAILVVSVIVVIVYRLFMSQKGSASIPGGFKFSWS